MNANVKRDEIINLLKKKGLKVTDENIVLDSDGKDICNFLPISEQRIIDRKHKLLISGIGAKNERLPDVLLDMTMIKKNLWVSENYGFEYYINKKRLDDFISIIRYLCLKTSTKNVYNHTGWIQKDNKWCYVHAKGCIGDTNVDVELEESIDNYYLPNKITNIHDVCKLSLKLCDVLKNDKGIILQSLVYLSPLVDIINQVGKPPDMVVWLWGKTGSRKTSLARAYLSHFGDFTNKIPCTFNDTKTSIELKANLLKDTLCLCDDFAPKQDRREMFNQNSIAEFIVRMYGDRVAKGRSNNKLEVKKMNIPRGMMLVTGESIISGESSNARLISLEVSRSTVNLGILTEIQNNIGLLGQAMRGYIESLLKQLNDENAEESLADTLIHNFQFYRDELMYKYKDIPHGRTIESISWLKVGFNCMLSYMFDIGAISEVESKEYEQRLEVVTDALLNNQTNLVTNNSPTDEFLNTLKELIDSNSIRLGTLNSKNQVIEDKLEYIHGYRDDNYYYFYRDKIYKAFVQEQYGKRAFIITGQNELLKQLKEEGIVKVDSNNDYPKKVIHVKDSSQKNGYRQVRPRMLHIEKTKIDNFTI